MFKLLLYFIASLLTVTFCYGQNIQIEKQLDSLLIEHLKSTEPGCEVLVAKGGQIIYKKAFGTADLELNVPVSANMVFNLASITKQFTAVAILQLVEQGKIGLQDSLQKFIPDFNVRSIEHSGKMSGFTSNEIYYPQQDVFIAALFNCENAPKDEILKGISEIVLEQSLQTKIKLSHVILSTYVGTYSLTTDPKRTIVVLNNNNQLLAKVSGQQTFEILFETTTKFQFKNIKGITGEFVGEKGTVSKIIVEQNGQFEWKKIK